MANKENNKQRCLGREHSPLAYTLRPLQLDEFVGQQHLLGEGKLLRRIIIAQKIPPLIFYGPPGCGKTTLGGIIARSINAEFHYVNAAFSSVAEIKALLKEAHKRLNEQQRRTVIFIDEILRFNKLQQESLVPDTEAGTINFIGATIYNPFYYLIRSLVSRAVISQFKPLTKDEIHIILKKALLDKKKGLGNFSVQITNKALEYISMQSAGDARKALTSLELGVLSTPVNAQGNVHIDLEVAKETIQNHLFYDKKETYHYDTISAFIKSIRGSDPDSALYWLAKMLVGGEDPRFIARRLVILASEDVGNADPHALVLATSCFQAVDFVGMPEANLILAQTTIYLACAPKSNASYKAITQALSDVEHEEIREVPEHLRTHSKTYRYPHDYFVNDEIGAYVRQEYGADRQYYHPLTAGEEKRLKRFLEILKHQQGNK